MSREIFLQRSFSIPKAKLDLFLVKLSMESCDLVHYEAEWIFNEGEFYDVVVNEYRGRNPFAFGQIEKFAMELKRREPNGE